MGQLTQGRTGRRTVTFFELLEPRCLLASNPVVTVDDVTSTTVTLQWDPIPDAAQVKVYLAPEPSSTTGAPLPNQVLVATLGGTATSYQFTNLAPATDAFLRVEADVPGPDVASNVHARTLGGPPATLDTPIREVHTYGPNVIQVVVEDLQTDASGQGNDGAAWKNGTWTVRRADTNTPINVTGVYRHSIPVGNPEAQLGYAAPYSDSVVAVDHRIYLVLGENIGSKEVLEIDGPFNTTIHFAFSDLYTETPVIQLNQVGYNPRATERWAYLSGWLGDGGSLSLAGFPTSATMLSEPVDPMAPRATATSNLPITVRSLNDADAGGQVNQINLASVPAAEGTRYRIRIPGVGVSWPTAVSEEAVFKSYYTVARGLFHNRWAGDLRLENTEWARPQDHVTRPDGTPTVYTGNQTDWTAQYPSSTPLTGPRTVIGGHHDAGDFDIRPMHTVVAQVLMRAYEAADPNTFSDNQLTLPESGNGVPDLLDEALWNIAGWEALQEANGGVRAGVESYRHPWGYYLAHEEPLPFWTYAIDPHVTARAAALFAQASRLVAPYDGARAAQLQTRAVNAYTYANGNGASNNDMLYAASELYRLTGQAAYKTKFETLYNAGTNMSPTQLAFSDFVDHSRSMPDYFQGYLGAGGASASLVSAITNRYNEAATNVVSALASSHAHRNPRGASDVFDWGLGTSVSRYLDTVYARLQAGGLSAQTEQQYLNALSLTADYVLGANPNGYVWFTGLGSRHVEQVLHLDSIAFDHMGQDQIPGIPVYGPTTGYGTGGASASAVASFYPSLGSAPLGLRYGDARVLVGHNEFTVWESQAPHAQLFSMLLGTGRAVPDSYLPGHADHRNPLTSFGPATNRAPVVEAGSKRTISLPTSTITLDGQMVDDGLTAGVTTTWSKVGGPASATVTFANASALGTTATFSQAGTYTLRLTANDGQASAIDEFTVVVKDPSLGIFTNGNFENGDLAGWATGNPSKVTVVPNTVGGNGNYVLHVDAGVDWATAVSSAPQKNDGVQQTNTNYELRFRIKWVTEPTDRKIKVAIVGNSGAAFQTTILSYADVGHHNWHDYTIPFNSGANDKFYVDFIHEGGGGPDRRYYLDNIIVAPAGATNQPPTVNAGADQTVTLPNSATLDGTASDDGLPIPSALTYTWTKVSGPGSVTFGNANAIDTTASFSVNGTYVLRLTASDGALSVSDELTVTVNAAPPPGGGGGSLYETGFDTNVSADWTLNNASVVTGTGDASYLGVNYGWGVSGYAFLAGGKAINAADVTVTGKMAVLNGSPSSFAEIAARTTGSGTDGIRLRVTGSYDQADVYLYDGNTLLASQLDVPGLRSQFAPLGFELELSGNTVTATITQAAGSGGGQSWTSKTVTLTGTIVNTTGAGNVRFAGYAYPERPRLYDLSVVAPNTPPVAVGDSYSMDQDDVLTVSAPGLLANDTDAEDDSLTAVKVSNPAHGTVTVNANGSFTYTPAVGYSGPDSFTYKVNDGAADSAAATVSITVNAVMPPPGGGSGTTLYETGFDSSVSGDWSLSSVTQTTGTSDGSYLAVNSGWGVVGTASLAGASAVNEADVTVTGKMAVGGGNSNMYAEVAARTTGSGTDGIRLRVTGSWDAASVYLYDGNTLLASQTNVSGLRTQLTAVSFELQVVGNAVTAIITQAAGTAGGQSWTDKTVTLAGTVTQSTAAGNVRFAGRSYTDQPKLYDIKVVTPAPQSIFSNGGFETGDLTGYSTGASSGVSVVANTVGGSGDHVLHVTAGDWVTPLSAYPQRTTAGQLPNTDYTFSFNMKWAANTGKTVRVRIVDEDGTVLATQLISSNTAWQTHTLTFNSGDSYANGVEPFHFEFIHEGGGGAARDYYLDELLVYPT